MPRIFLIPAISIFDVHDTAVRDWLNKQKDSKIREYLDYPYRLDNLFLESVKQAIICAERVYEETLKLVDSINPQAVFLEISQEHIKLENDYNSRKIASDSPFAAHLTSSASIPLPFSTSAKPTLYPLKKLLFFKLAIFQGFARE